MDEERLASYLHSLEEEDSPLMQKIAREAVDARIPILRRETAGLLKTLVSIKQPRHILEVGTAVGYSALLMARHMPPDGRITTIEKEESRVRAARDHFYQAEEERRITLLCGDAALILKELEGPFDFIFMDAAKGQYIRFLPKVLRLLPPGGVLVSDNVLQEGSILESRFAIPRRERTIHSRMRAYLYELTHCEELQTAVVPIGDGVTISTRLLSGPAAFRGEGDQNDGQS